MGGFAGKRYWLVGGSDGLGLALARQMRAEGADLVISARNAERLAGVCAELGAEALPMDMADAASVAQAAGALGPVDGVVLLAAVYWPMSAQALDADKLVAMCDVNLTGTARVLGAVLPAMIARGAGHVVLTGSWRAIAACRGRSAMPRLKGARWCWPKACMPICGAAGLRCNWPIRGSLRPG
jgi:NADP-dependent 3-hydroxy acid dehydrogenase YdfG